MTTKSEPDPSRTDAGDKVNLDDLFRDAKPIGDASDWAIPGFFVSDDEFEEFQAWLKAERASGMA